MFNKQVFDTKLTDFLDKETVLIHEAFYCVNKNLTYAALLFSLILFQLNFSMRQSEPEELYLKSCLIKKCSAFLLFVSSLFILPRWDHFYPTLRWNLLSQFNQKVCYVAGKRLFDQVGFAINSDVKPSCRTNVRII